RPERASSPAPTCSSTGKGGVDARDRDQTGVADRFLVGALEVGEGAIGHVRRGKADGGGIGWLQALDQCLGRQQRPAGGRLLEAGTLVDLVAQCSDLESPAGDYLAHVQRGTPVHP